MPTIVYDHAEIKRRLRGDDWWEPRPKDAVAPMRHEIDEYTCRCKHCGINLDQDKAGMACPGPQPKDP